MKTNQWVINPPLEMADVLAQYGRFLATDYRVLFESMGIPEVFEDNLAPSGRRFAIIGGDENPALLAKSIFLCAKLSGAESIDIKSSHLDEIFIAQNVLHHHADGIDYHAHTSMFEGVHLSHRWSEALDRATDIIVYGDENTLRSYRDYETPDRRVWEYGESFSLGVINAEDINHVIASAICFDFVSFYGHGRLAPKFYFVIGTITTQMVRILSGCMVTMFRDAVEEYRDKLPFTRKSDLTQKYINSDYASFYVRINRIDDDDLFDPLYGDVRLVEVDSYDDVEAFIKEHRDYISTVAINYDNDSEEIFNDLSDMMVPRICDIGDMQFPDFFEQYDIIDDFIIYVADEEE